MRPQVFWFCFTLPLVSMYRIDVVTDMTTFRKYAREQQCDLHTSLVEIKPCGILECFNNCLQLAACSHIRFHSKGLVCKLCTATNTVPSGKPKNSQSTEDWICWKKTNLVPCSECQPRSTCVKSRSGETKCVHDDLQEKKQSTSRMSTHPRRNRPILNITQQDFEDKWTTTKMHGRAEIISLTWSPLFARDIYGLTVTHVIHLFMFKGHLPKEKVRSVYRLPPLHRGLEWITIDTGLCLRNDSMSCIFLFGTVIKGPIRTMYLKSIREFKSPRRLVAERDEKIEQNHPSYLEVLFSCNMKFGMAVSFVDNTEIKKYVIQAGEGALTLNGERSVEGLDYPLDIKWNNDGSFGIALTDTTLYIIKYYDDKEQVLMEVDYEWLGECVPVWIERSILVYEKKYRFSKEVQIRVLKISLIW